MTIFAREPWPGLACGVSYVDWQSGKRPAARERAARAGDDKDERKAAPPKDEECDCDPDDPDCDCHDEEDDEVTEAAKARAYARCETILASPHADAFPSVAKFLAFKTRSSAAEAKGILKVFAQPETGAFAHLRPPAAVGSRRRSADDRYVPPQAAAQSPQEVARQVLAVAEKFGVVRH